MRSELRGRDPCFIYWISGSVWLFLCVGGGSQQEEPFVWALRESYQDPGSGSGTEITGRQELNPYQPSNRGVVLPLPPTAKEMPHAEPTLGVSAPHLYYTCPEGATVKLVCAQRGTKLHPEDQLHHYWLFTQHSQQHCHDKVGPRHTRLDHHTKVATAGLSYGGLEQNFWVALENVTIQDQGRYCCVVLEHEHATMVHTYHSHVVLHVTPRTNGSQDCTVWDPQPPESTAFAAVATAACIVALLSLPLIMLLVYKQRHQVRSSRRAHELVRMDSEAQGHENPVFLGGSPQPKTRTVSQIMTRQSSETGRHLLSEPGTPLSPPVQGDVFFPIHDAIPESPDFMQM
ncbi:V-type immunoglobulin domain-containing suppressor of T-cell activation [Merluccius polli]|nr:V-type immunoglobulin domain-containing suppressor of T-cell activation [Merluccius polli]